MQTHQNRLIEITITSLAVITLGGYGLYATRSAPVDIAGNSESDGISASSLSSFPSEDTKVLPTPAANVDAAVKTPTVAVKPIPPAVAPDTKKRILQKVPFIAQAPFGDWKNPRQQDGCEEASSLMAVLWARGKTMTPQQGLTEILTIAAYEEKTVGTYHDTSAEDTLKHVINGYFQYTNARVRTNITTNDIRDELYKGNIVIIPANGQKLGNPNFTAPGPERHMLVIIGYNPAIDRFITNDPGTRKGAGYQYTPNAIQRSLLNYPTGHHEPIVTPSTAMIVVSK